MIGQQVTYKKDETPAVSFTNRIGSMIASVTGTPSQFGSWRLRIDSGPNGEKMLTVINNYSSDFRQRPVLPSQALTDIIDGLTVTLGATLNVGDTSDVSYLDVIVDSVP